MLTFYQYLAFILPFIFVFIKGYFLSIEFSLYPYLISAGLLPYKDIVDQHFPSLFFGTFSLPFALVNSPEKLLFILTGLNLATTFLLFATLKKLKADNYQLWTLIFSLLLIFFSANTLWIETFICFLLALVFYLNTNGGWVAGITIGTLISQIVLMRPTLVIFLLGYYIFLVKNKVPVFIGAVVGSAFSILYLIRHDIVGDFYNVAIIFNRDVYANLQSPSPSLRQILSVSLLAITFTALAISKKNFMSALVALPTIILIFPRFGLEHLQVFGLVFVYFLAQLKLSKVITNLVFVICLLVGIQSWLSIYKASYGNYFYSQDTVSAAKQIATLEDKNIYLFGASDLIYQLAEKLPPNNYYLPSLPWYLNYEPFKTKLIDSLKSTNTIIVDPEFSVDGQKLTSSAQSVYAYIKMNYYLAGKINNLEVYKQNK